MCLRFPFQDPPHIEGSGGTAEVSVVVNNVLELHCEASGIPTPSLTWLKDGRPLPQTDSLQLLRGGGVLRVASAQVSRPAGFNPAFESKSLRNVVRCSGTAVHLGPPVAAPRYLLITLCVSGLG